MDRYVNKWTVNSMNKKLKKNKFRNYLLMITASLVSTGSDKSIIVACWR